MFNIDLYVLNIVSLFKRVYQVWSFSVSCTYRGSNHLKNKMATSMPIHLFFAVLYLLLLVLIVKMPLSFQANRQESDKRLYHINICSISWLYSAFFLAGHKITAQAKKIRKTPARHGPRHLVCQVITPLKMKQTLFQTLCIILYFFIL